MKVFAKFGFLASFLSWLVVQMAIGPDLWFVSVVCIGCVYFVVSVVCSCHLYLLFVCDVCSCRLYLLCVYLLFVSVVGGEGGLKEMTQNNQMAPSWTLSRTPSCSVLGGDGGSNLIIVYPA